MHRHVRQVKGAADMHCPYCRNTDTRVLDSRVADDGGAIRRRRSCNECGKRFSTVEQMQLVVVKRVRRDRAVHPREGDRRRPQGLQGPAGLRGRPGLPRPAGRGRAAQRGLGRGARPTRSAWPSSARCASSTRWPTCGSPASTAPSSRPTTSRPRSRCCEPSAPPTAVEPVERSSVPTSAHGLTPTARAVVGKRRVRAHHAAALQRHVASSTRTAITGRDEKRSRG